MMSSAFHFISIISMALVSGLVSSCLVSVYLKYKEPYQIYRKKWMPEEPCEFCMGFWFTVPTWIGLMLWSSASFEAWPYYLIPFMGAAVAKWTNLVK